MKIPRITTIALLVLSSFAATGVAPTKSELETMYDKAFRQFDSGQYDDALKSLDAIDARQPDLAESENLRGVVLMRKGDYDHAEIALRKALDNDPKFWNASFNLAEIPFLKKNWAEARNRFEALMAGNSDEMRPETRLLIQYKVLLTFVLQDKENMVDWIINKFEDEKDSPALYYANAALALHHNNEKEAKDWIDSATKKYPASLNKLFAESFYEVGWLQKPTGETRAAVEITSTAERADRLKADSQANFERAERSFEQRDFGSALKFLDLVDEGTPNQAPSYNLRGEVFMEEQKFDQAEEQFRKAFDADPKFREAQYNLAQIPFKKKDYAKSRERLEALFGETPGGDQNQAAQLIKYKIYMTLLLEGHDAEAQHMMEQFKFTGDTPALYYAQAAWSFKHGNADQGNDWISSARKIYSPALNIVFADSFYDLGWLQRAPETAPTTTALATADSSPPAGPTPQMRFGQSEPLPAPVAATSPTNVAAAATAAPARVQSSVAPAPARPTPAPATVIAQNNATPAPIIANIASSPAAVVAQSAATPAASIAKPIPVPAATVAAAAVSTPAFRAIPSPAITRTTAASVPATPAAKKAPVIVSANSAVTPAATALAPAAAREYSEPSFAELMDRISEPRTLLVGLLLLSGLGLLGWLIIQQVRRPAAAASSVYEAPLPLTEPRFAGPSPVSPDEHRLSRDRIDGGPPKLSLQLKGSEPAVRAVVLPSGVVGARANAPAAVSAPIGIGESVSEVKAIAPTEKVAPVSPPPKVAEARRPEVKTAPPIQPNERDKSAAKIAPATLKIVEAKPAPFARPNEPAVIAKPVPPPAKKEAPVSVPFAPVFAKKAEQKPLPADTIAAPVAQQPKPAPLTAVSTPKEPAAPPVKVETKPAVAPIAAETAAASALAAGSASAQSSIETPAIASKIITTKPVTTPSTTTLTMPEPTPITAINEPRPAAAGIPGAPTAPPSAAMQTAVQLTFSLEIASLQLTPTFKMGALQVKPISKIVAMRLAPSAQPQPAMNLQITFELSSVQLGAGASLGTVRLTPSSAQRPTPITSPSFEISGLQLVSSSAAAPVQLTPTHQGQASVLMTASFQIATVEFSPSFEIASVVLNSTSKNVAVQLPGAGPSSIEAAPVFEIGNVQVGGNSEITMIQLNPLGGGAGRRG